MLNWITAKLTVYVNGVKAAFSTNSNETTRYSYGNEKVNIDHNVTPSTRSVTVKYKVQKLKV